MNLEDKKKDILFLLTISFSILIFLTFYSNIALAQENYTFNPEYQEGEETQGFGFDDAVGVIISIIGIGFIILLRYFQIIPDSLYNPLLIFGLLGLFYILQNIFDAIGFEINIGGIIIPPLAIGLLLIFFVYHNAILQLLHILKTI